MSVIRYRALKALGDYLEDNIAALKGKVVVLRSESEHEAEYPGLALVPRVMRFDPMQAEEVWQEDDPVTSPFSSTLLENVGCFTGTVELRMNASTAPRREEVEDAIINLFLEPEGQPGVLVVRPGDVTVGGVATLYDAPCAFVLENSEWNDEQVFDKHRYSFMDVDFTVPALVARTEYTIEQLYVAITHDLESDTPVETVQIDEEGNLST